MKKSLKLVSVILSIAVMVISLPVNPIFSELNVQAVKSIYETVTFKFDGEDEFEFYNSFDDEANPTPIFENPYEDASPGTSTAAVNTESNVFEIGNVTAKSGKTLTANCFGNFASPDAEVFENRTLHSLSFDINLGAVDQFNPIVAVGINNNGKYIGFRFGVNINYFSGAPDCICHTGFNYTNSNYAVTPRDWEYSLQNTTAIANNGWAHYEIEYIDTGLKVTVSADGKSNTLTWTTDSSKIISPEKRFIAFTSAYMNSNDKPYQIDNVVLNFIPDDIKNFADSQYTKETLELDPENIAPYDFTRINAVVEEYEKYRDEKPNLLENEYFEELNNKLPVLKTAVETWGKVDTSENVAESFYKLYFKDKSDVDYAKAYNIYRRLSKAERTKFKATYSAEYSAMNTAIKESGADDDGVISIAAVGDGITHYGTWPSRLQNRLNCKSGFNKFVVNNFGAVGTRILGDNGTDDLSVKYGDYRTDDKYYKSITANHDIVIIMLGSNDANEIDLSDSNGVLKAERYVQYKSVFTDLVQSYLALDCNAEVVIASNPNLQNPTKEYTNRFNALKSLFQEVANEYDLKIIDVLEFTNNSMTAADYTDELHFTDAGSDKLGDFYYENIAEYCGEDKKSAFIFNDSHNYADAEVIDATLTKPQIKVSACKLCGMNNEKTEGFALCDFNQDGLINSADNLIYETSLNALEDITDFDIDRDGVLGEFDKTVIKLLTLEVPLNELFDANADGMTDIRDLLRIVRLSAGVITEGNSDLNRDGTFNSDDLNCITKCLLHINTTEAINTMKNSIKYIPVQNPLVADGGADPWVVEKDGKYYFCRTFGTGVSIAKLNSLDEISTAEFSKVYTPPTGTMYSKEYWAPELHYLNGEWYIYVAADDGNNVNHRMYVLKGTSQDPTDPFEFVGQITDSTNKWAIDGTVVEIKDELYFVWSGWEGDTNVAQNIYIAHMSDPCTIDSERVLISIPEYDWEKKNRPLVNEGPAALYRGDDVYVAFSASGSWDDNYCMGLLTLVGDDPLNAASWQKSSEPFMKSKAGAAYGPGHCSFTTAEDGSTWMVYHANLVSHSGYNGRSIWIAPVFFDKNGKPIFSEAPLREVDLPVSIK